MKKPGEGRALEGEGELHSSGHRLERLRLRSAFILTWLCVVECGE